MNDANNSTTLCIVLQSAPAYINELNSFAVRSVHHGSAIVRRKWLIFMHRNIGNYTGSEVVVTQGRG
jgi:hypothetical protein